MPSFLRLRVATLIPFLLCGASAQAAEKPEVLLDIGVGPAANLYFGPVFDAQPALSGLKISLVAIANAAAIRKNLKRVPKQYRNAAKGLTEVRIKPFFLSAIPTHILISPPVYGTNTGGYGATFHVFGVGAATGSSALQASLNADIALSYAYLFSDRFPTTHFVRPGLAVAAEVELEIVKSFAMSTGWQSTFYPPQEVGGFGFAPLDRAIWHEGQVFLKFHFRTPYTGKY